jgi:hypothetical protein
MCNSRSNPIGIFKAYEKLKIGNVGEIGANYGVLCCRKKVINFVSE